MTTLCCACMILLSFIVDTCFADGFNTRHTGPLLRPFDVTTVPRPILLVVPNALDIVHPTSCTFSFAFKMCMVENGGGNSK